MDYDKLLADRLGEPSSAIRTLQRDRLAKPLPEDTLSAQRNGSLLNKSNADMGPAEVREYCKLDEAGKALVKAAMTQLQLSARAFHRILKLARTIADPSGTQDRLSTTATPSRPTTSLRHYSIAREGRCKAAHHVTTVQCMLADQIHPCREGLD